MFANSFWSKQAHLFHKCLWERILIHTGSPISQICMGADRDPSKFPCFIQASSPVSQICWQNNALLWIKKQKLCIFFRLAGPCLRLTVRRRVQLAKPKKTHTRSFAGKGKMVNNYQLRYSLEYVFEFGREEDLSRLLPKVSNTEKDAKPDNVERWKRTRTSSNTYLEGGISKKLWRTKKY